MAYQNRFIVRISSSATVQYCYHSRESFLCTRNRAFLYHKMSRKKSIDSVATQCSTQKPLSHSPIIPTINYRLAQLFGVFPYRYPWKSPLIPPPVNIPLVCWSIAQLVAILTCLIPWTGGLAAMYKRQLAKTEFFAIVSFVFKITIYLQGPVLLVVGLVKSRRLPILVARMESSLGEAVPADGHKHIFRTAVILWNVVYVGLGMYAYYISFRNIAGLVNRIVEDFLYEIGFYNGPRTPPYLFASLMAAMMFLNLCGEAFPVTLVLTIVREINRGFTNINKGLKRILKDPGSADTAYALKTLREQYLRLQCHMADADDIFSGLLLIGALREFLGFIAVMAALMQVNPERQFLTSEDANEAEIDLSTRHMVYGFGIMGLINMGLKFYVSVCTHDEAQTIRVNLRKVSARCPDQTIQQACGAFILECEESDGSISAGGFFRITRESVTSLVEMMITYVLLIYQARDTKMDISELPTKEDINAFRAEMRQRTAYCAGDMIMKWNLTNNSTDAF